MQSLIQAWTTVDKKDKYEFRLRVAKRKDAANGGAAAGPNAGPEKIVPGATNVSAAGQQAQMSDMEKLKNEVSKLEQEYRALQQEKIKANATLSQLSKLEDSKSFAVNKSNSSVNGKIFYSKATKETT